MMIQSIWIILWVMLMNEEEVINMFINGYGDFCEGGLEIREDILYTNNYEKIAKRNVGYDIDYLLNPNVIRSGNKYAKYFFKLEDKKILFVSLCDLRKLHYDYGNLWNKIEAENTKLEIVATIRKRNNIDKRIKDDLEQIILMRETMSKISIARKKRKEDKRIEILRREREEDRRMEGRTIHERVCGEIAEYVERPSWLCNRSSIDWIENGDE